MLGIHFLVNVPIGVLALVLATRWVPSREAAKTDAMPDLFGAGVLALAIGALSLALVKSDVWGWSSALTLTTLALSFAALAWFGVRSSRHLSPVVELSLLRVRSFAWANVAVVTFSVGFAANLLANILWMQHAWHYSALRTGLGVAPGPLTVLVFAAVGQTLSRKLSVGIVAAAGCLLCGSGSVLVLLSVGPAPSYVTDMLPGWMIFGAGVGLALPTILSVATVDLPAARTATGSAVVTMARQVGTVVGVSMLVALLGHASSYEATHLGLERVWWASATIGVIAAASSLGMSPRTRAASRAALASG